MSRLGKNSDPEICAVGPIDRHAIAVASLLLDTRWLFGVAVIVPMLIVAGVYWLKPSAGGERLRTDETTLDVRLLDDLTPSNNVKPLVARSIPEDLPPNEPLAEVSNPIPKRMETGLETKAAASSFNSRPQMPVKSGHPVAIATGSAEAFRRTLLSHIARYRRYPAEAVPGLRGVVHVLFVMQRDGAVSEAWVGKSSGDHILDQSALTIVNRAQPLPGIPSDLPDRLTISIPILFEGR